MLYCMLDEMLVWVETSFCRPENKNLDNCFGKMPPASHLHRLLVNFLVRRSHWSRDCCATSVQEEEQDFDFPWMAKVLFYHYEILLLCFAPSMMKKIHYDWLGPCSEDVLCGRFGCHD